MTARQDILRRVATGLAALWLGCAPGSSLAQAGVAPTTDTAAVPAGDSRPVDLLIANRKIFTLRGDAYGATPVERVRNIRAGVDLLVERGGPMAVSTLDTPEGIAVLVDGNLVFRVLNTDVNAETGETTRSVVDQAVRNLTRALAEIREAHNSSVMAPAIGYALLATVALALVLWLLVKVYGRLAHAVRGAVQRRSASLAPGWGSHVAGRAGLVELATVPLRMFAWLIALLLVYEWTAFVFELFPYTRPWGEALFGNMLDALSGFARAALHAVPGLLFVLLIFLVTRFIVRVVRIFFEGVQAGRIQLSWVDDTTAPPTGRLLTVFIWLFALVAAYPYLPGSGSEAFKGIGVFVGLMLSIGASGIVNQAVSGLMLMYTRALRPGEFVQIGDVEGTVKSVGFVTTRIETLRREEINMPNALIATAVTRNYSRLAGEGGVRIATKLTIGYDVPWRQVQAMLQVAAGRTAGLSQDPPPRVLQTALHDFYVEYTVLITVPNPALKVGVLNELHGHVQDVFNEHGVQIMSPNYEADPAQPKVVPRENWFAAPAAPAESDRPPRP